MRLSRLTNRAALLGFVGVAACDVYAIATDPFPGLVQTWNLPVTETSISVASLLPTGVAIYSTPASTPPDSSAFSVTMPAIAYNQPLAPNCAACLLINGTTAPKPAFNIGNGNGSRALLPANVVSATVLGASITYTIVNGLSFDPIRVNPSNPTGLQQGQLDIIIRSNSEVLAMQTLRGDTATLPAGSTFSRTISLATGIVRDSINVDVLVNSPAGEPVLMDASRSIAVSATVTGLRVGAVTINVPTASLNSGTPEQVDIGELDESFTERAIGGGLELTVTNPFAVAGNMNVTFTPTPGPAISKTATLNAVTTPQRLSITLDSLEISRILKSNPSPTLSMGGSVSAPAPITVTPKQVIAMSNRIVLKIRAFGGTD
jgi:hypothetical protein